MRDDLAELIRKLVLLYKDKKTLLEKFTFNEIELRRFLQKANSIEINNLIQADSDIIARLDSIEFDIHAIIEKICKISGIEKENFDKYFLSREIEIIHELKTITDDIKKLSSGLIAERDEFIRAMENRLAEMKKDLKDFKMIKELKDWKD